MDECTHLQMFESKMYNVQKDYVQKDSVLNMSAEKLSSPRG